MQFLIMQYCHSPSLNSAVNLVNVDFPSGSIVSVVENRD